MTTTEKAVAEHYGVTDLLGRIFKGLEASGVNLTRLTHEDLAPVDEFHIGGRAATDHAVAALSPGRADHVLDIGCGIGGAARYMASTIGCRVTGIDLTEEFIEAAEALTQKTGHGDRIKYEVANALNLPFETGVFDKAITLHVAMNIQDRPGLYREIARVLKPDAVFCIYDVMKSTGGEIVYPVPWAETADTSFLASLDDMQTLLGDAGFEVFEVEDRTDFARDFFKKATAAAADSGAPPVLGLNLLMGDSAPLKFKNMLDNILAGRIAVVQMLARR